MSTRLHPLYPSDLWFLVRDNGSLLFCPCMSGFSLFWKGNRLSIIVNSMKSRTLSPSSPWYWAWEASCHPACLTYMQSTSCKMLGWTKHKLESRLLGEISITSDMQMIPSLWQKGKKNLKASWWKWKRKMKKLAWNSTFRKLRSWHLVLSLHGK